MFSDIISLGLKVTKVILDEKLNEGSKETFDEIFDALDKMLND